MGEPLKLETAYLGSVDRFAAMARARRAVICNGARFNKRDKVTHRATIADANGVIDLTVPIAKPVSLSKALWSDVEVSGHNGWWNIHFTALQSAYGRTPYFEFYADDFAAVINADAAGMKLVDFNRRLDELILRLACVETEVDFTDDVPDEGEWWRGEEMNVAPYYQTRMERHGFIPHLSIVDMLFNHGPETGMLLAADKI